MTKSIWDLFKMSLSWTSTKGSSTLKSGPWSWSTSLSLTESAIEVVSRDLVLQKKVEKPQVSNSFIQTQIHSDTFLSKCLLMMSMLPPMRIGEYKSVITCGRSGYILADLKGRRKRGRATRVGKARATIMHVFTVDTGYVRNYASYVPPVLTYRILS